MILLFHFTSEMHQLYKLRDFRAGTAVPQANSPVCSTRIPSREPACVQLLHFQYISVPMARKAVGDGLTPWGPTLIWKNWKKLLASDQLNFNTAAVWKVNQQMKHFYLSFSLGKFAFEIKTSFKKQKL